MDAEEASEKMAAKKNRTATAMAPNNVMIFTFMCGVASHNLTLPFNGKSMFRFLTYAHAETWFILRFKALMYQ